MLVSEWLAFVAAATDRKSRGMFALWEVVIQKKLSDIYRCRRLTLSLESTS